MGGLAIFLSFALVALIYYFLKPDLFVFAPWHKYDLDIKFLGIGLGALILVVVGLMDDKKSLSPWAKLIFQIIAALLVVFSGTRVEYFNNPFGGFINLDIWQFDFTLSGITFSLVPLADLFSLFWIVAIINVVNFLDGLDGLAAGVSFLASMSIFFISLLLTVFQPATALFSAILCGSLLGFLFFNFNPAKIFMGDSGSQFLGYILAVFAIISGAKMATAFLVLGFPILDGLWVILRRIKERRSPFYPDKNHLHHRLLRAGFSIREAVLFLYVLSIAFGVVGILSTTYGKLVALIVLVAVMVIIALILLSLERKNVKESH